MEIPFIDLNPKAIIVGIKDYPEWQVLSAVSISLRYPICVTEDGLSSNAPHIKILKKHNCSYILGIKPGNHAFLFDYVNLAVQNGKAVEFECIDENDSIIIHRYRFLNNAPLNKSNLDIQVNFLEYWKISEKKTFWVQL